MNKLFTKITSLALGAAMMIGVDVSVGSKSKVSSAHADTQTIAFEDLATLTGYTSGTQNNLTATVSNVTFTFEQISAKDGQKVQVVKGKNVTSTAFPGVVKELVVYNCSHGSSKYSDGGFTVYGSTDGTTWSDSLYSNTSMGKNYGTETVDLSSNTSYTYLKLTISSDRVLKFDRIDVTYETGGSTKTATTTSVSAAKTELETGHNPADYVDLNVEVRDTSDNLISNPSLTYSSSNTSVATVSAGRVTAVAAGSTTITVSYAGDDNYDGSNGTLGITVVVPATPLPSSGTITIDPSVLGNYGTDVAYTVPEDNTPNSKYGFSCTDVTKGTGSYDGKIQFKKSSGTLYSTTPVEYLISVTVTGDNSSDAVVTYGTTSNSGCTSSDVGTNNKYFKIVNGNTSNARYWNIVIEYGVPITLNGIEAALDSTASGKTYYVDDTIAAADVDVTTSYSDSDLNSTIEDGTGVFFDSNYEASTFTFTQSGDAISVPVYYQDPNGRTSNNSFNVAVQPARSVVAWSYEGSIGETALGKPYNLSGLTLKAWYDQGKTQEAPSNVEARYEFVADPASAGQTADQNNKINLKVYLKTDIGRDNCLATITNVPAPVVTAPKGSIDNPYTVAEAMAAITWTTNTHTDDKYYAEGYVKKTINASTNHAYFLVDDPNDTTSGDQDCLEGYSRSAPTGFDEYATGDKVKIYGYLSYYNGQKQIGAGGDGNGFEIIAVDPETLDLVLSVTEETVTWHDIYSYSGSITADYKHRNDVEYDPNDTKFTISSTVNTNVVGDYSYSVTYYDGLFESITESCTVHVSYATVSSITLTEHIVNMGVDDGHQFTAQLNPNVDPSSTITWSVANDTGSSIPKGEFEISATGELTTMTETAGTLIVTASCGGYSDTCTVTVTGDPYVTFNKASIEGIVGATLNNQVTATAKGLSGTPSTYTWSVTSGADVVSVSGSTATATLTFLKDGQATVHVSISDGGAKPATGDIEVNVIKSLASIIGPDDVDSKTATWTYDQSIAQTKDTLVDVDMDANIHMLGDKGTNSTKFRFWTDGIRCYAGNSVSFTPSNGYSITSITLPTISGTCSDSQATKSGNVYTIKNGSTTISFTGLTAGTIKDDIVVTYEKSTPGHEIANTDYQVQKAVIEFAEDLTSKLNAVCDADGNTTITGEGGLDAYWTAILGTYNTKKTESGNATLFNQLIANCTKSDAANADPLQKALSSYDYVCAKYGAQLTSGDFLNQFAGRESAHYPSIVNPISLFSGESAPTTIIIIISVIGVSALGGFFFLRKRKEI